MIKATRFEKKNPEVSTKQWIEHMEYRMIGEKGELLTVNKSG